jgi:hypothetical protein
MLLLPKESILRVAAHADSGGAPGLPFPCSPATRSQPQPQRKRQRVAHVGTDASLGCGATHGKRGRTPGPQVDCPTLHDGGLLQKRITSVWTAAGPTGGATGVVGSCDQSVTVPCARALLLLAVSVRKRMVTGVLVYMRRVRRNSWQLMVLVSVLLVLLPWILCALWLLVLVLLERMWAGARVADASGDQVYSDSDDKCGSALTPNHLAPHNISPCIPPLGERPMTS